MCSSLIPCILWWSKYLEMYSFLKFSSAEKWVGFQSCTWYDSWLIFLLSKIFYARHILCLKALDTFGNCRRPVFSHGVSQHIYICIITSLCANLDKSSKLQENNKRKSTLKCYTNLCVFICLKMLQDWVLLIFVWEITSFTKTKLLQRELFLAMFYTINDSPLHALHSKFLC